MEEQQEYIIAPSGRKYFNWKELQKYSELFYFFAWRDIKIKYKQTVLGFLWAVLQPLLMMIIFTYFFGRPLKVPTEGLPYPVFVLSGLLIWNIFSMGLSQASTSMINNAPIIKKIYFPRIVIPISAVFGALFDFVMALAVFFIMLLLFRQPVSPHALWSWPLAILLAVIATLGPSCLFAALNVKYRDFRYVIPFMIQALLFLTPVLYPVSMFDYPGLRYFLTFSPLYAAIEFFRFPLTGIMPDPMHLLISFLSGVVLLWVGLIYFRRTEDFFCGHCLIL